MARGSATLLHSVPITDWLRASPTSGKSIPPQLLDLLNPERCGDGNLNSTEPVEALILPIPAGVHIGDLDRSDPFGLLEAELGGHPQTKREAERIGDRLLCIFCRENSLRMQCARHVDAARIVVGATERDVFGRQVGT